MSQSDDYLLDQTNENTRLLRQHQQLKALIGGLVPPEIDPSRVHSALDLACGPGAWALDFARTYPQAQVVGVDIAKIALAEAKRLATREHLANVSFAELDIARAEGLPFPNSYFDLVWARAVFMHLPAASWEPLLRELYRVLRPNGAIVIVDTDAQSGSTSNAEYQRLRELLITLAARTGRTARFGPLGPGLLRRAGFGQIYMHPLLQEWSLQQGDRPVPEDIRRAQANALSLIANGRAAVVGAKLISAEEFDQLFEAATQKFANDRDQVLLEILFVISGRKPAEHQD
jgi:ubiquinone/menaquinone biosynthesis C-methylase UbiE